MLLQPHAQYSTCVIIPVKIPNTSKSLFMKEEKPQLRYSNQIPFHTPQGYNKDLILRVISLQQRQCFVSVVKYTSKHNTITP